MNPCAFWGYGADDAVGTRSHCRLFGEQPTVAVHERSAQPTLIGVRAGQCTFERASSCSPARARDADFGVGALTCSADGRCSWPACPVCPPGFYMDYSSGSGACRLLIRPVDTQFDVRGGCAGADADGFVWYGRHDHCTAERRYASPSEVKQSPAAPYANMDARGLLAGWLGLGSSWSKKGAGAATNAYSALGWTPPLGLVPDGGGLLSHDSTKSKEQSSSQKRLNTFATTAASLRPAVTTQLTDAL